MIMIRLNKAFNQESWTIDYEVGRLIPPCYERTLLDLPLGKWIYHLYALGLVK